MTSIRKPVAVVGLGHVGRGLYRALSEDMEFEVTAFVDPASGQSLDNGIPLFANTELLSPPTLAFLAVPTDIVTELAESLLSRGIYCVDCFDRHGPAFWEHHSRLQHAARHGGSVAMVASGWDPGSDSVLRGLFQAMAPKGVTFTNFGPGMSMGHSVAARSIPGVRDAMALTLPLGAGRHRRLVYLELDDDASYESVCQELKSLSPFTSDELSISVVEDLAALWDAGHGVVIERKAGASGASNQRFRYEMQIDNPALTAQIMLSAARAAYKRPAPGAYQLLEVPILDLLSGDRHKLLQALV